MGRLDNASNLKHASNIPLVTTIQERCRVCYTCVRECPAKAIRIADGQAEVIAERCIGCGNCVRVCSQRAKNVLGGIDTVRRLLAEPGGLVSACLAPSFPAEFIELEYDRLVGMLRTLGFELVNEVAFGADLVADCLLTNLDLLAGACAIFRRLCVEGLQADADRCRLHVESGTAILTALVERIGYESAQQVALSARESGKTIREVVVSCRLMSAQEFDELTSPEKVTRLGSPPAENKPKE